VITELNEFLQEIYAEEFGLLPVYGSIKPVHVANGLGRALVGRTYSSDALAQFLRRSILNQTTRVQEERSPNAMILEHYSEAFTGRDGVIIDHDALSTLRSLAEGILATDGAVFGEAARSSYTLSNETLLTRDPSDYRSGVFLANILVAGGAGEAAGLIRELLASDDDPWSTIALPMMQFARLQDVPHAPDEQTPPRQTPTTAGDTGTPALPTLAKLRASFDRLARFERARGSKLNSLRRLVMFGCFAIHVHLIARYADVVDGAPRPPILIDMFDGSRTSLRNASRASLRAAGDVLEAFGSLRIRERVSEELKSASIEEIVSGLRETNKNKKVRERVRQGFEAYRHDDQVSESDALSEALWQVGTEDSLHPVEYLTELGRRAGYLTPWANSGRGGKLQKRYGVTTEFLETLVAATVEPGRPLDFPEFLDALRVNYGIIVGQRSDDQVVQSNNLAGVPFGTPTSVAEEDLRLNVEALRRATLEAGYAKAYADGQTVVTTDPESLAIL